MGTNREARNWLQPQSWVSSRYRAREEMSEGDVMENIYSVRSVHPRLLSGGDFEHRRADVSLLQEGEQALPSAGQMKSTSGKFCA